MQIFCVHAITKNDTSFGLFMLFLEEKAVMTRRKEKAQLLLPHPRKKERSCMYPKPGGSLHVINTEKSDVNLLDLFFGSFSDCIALN